MEVHVSNHEIRTGASDMYPIGRAVDIDVPALNYVRARDATVPAYDSICRSKVSVAID